MTAVDDALDRLEKNAHSMEEHDQKDADLATVRDELQRLREQLADSTRRAFLHLQQREAAEAELQAVVSVLPGLPEGRTPVEYAQDIALGARRAVAEKEAAEAEAAAYDRKLMETIPRAEAAEVEVQRLTEGLRGLLIEIGDPMDVDQDCRFCGAHNYTHRPGCAWDIARALIADSPPDGKPVPVESLLDDEDYEVMREDGKRDKTDGE